jgi:hypothetical protein
MSRADPHADVRPTRGGGGRRPAASGPPARGTAQTCDGLPSPCGAWRAFHLIHVLRPLSRAGAPAGAAGAWFRHDLEKPVARQGLDLPLAAPRSCVGRRQARITSGLPAPPDGRSARQAESQGCEQPTRPCEGAMDCSAAPRTVPVCRRPTRPARGLRWALHQRD